MDLSEYSDDEIDNLLRDQAAILFKQCDHGNKNYVTQEDLVSLSRDLDLSEDLVIEAFQRLDINKNNFLTLREFISGFGLFLGIESDSNIEEIDLTEKSLKAIELFNLCDTDRKGYVTKFDLSKLTSELGLTDEQVALIFNQLDDDNNGFISLSEFIDGFSSFVPDDTTINNNEQTNEKIENGHCKPDRKKSENGFDEKYFADSWSKPSLCRTVSNRFNRKNTMERSDSDISNASQRSFITRQMSIRYESGSYGADEVIEKLNDEVGSSISKDQLFGLWSSVSNTGDHMTAKMFENFLEKVYSEIKSAKQEAKHLEDVLEKKSQHHNEEIKRIYDEMEVTVQTEKQKQRELVMQRENLIREDLSSTLQERENQLEKLMQRQVTLENRLNEVREQEKHLKYQNTKLLKENVDLEDKLNDSLSDLNVLKTNLHTLEQQTTQEKKETLRAAVQATQNISTEHDHLIRQLDILRNMNQKLRDDRDTIEASLKSKTFRLQSFTDEAPMEKLLLTRTGSAIEKYLQGSATDGSYRSTSTPTHSPLKKKGSVLSTYFQPIGEHVHPEINHLDRIAEQNEDTQRRKLSEEDEDVFVSQDNHLHDSKTQPVIDMVDMIPNSTAIETSDKSSSNIEAPSSPRRPPVGMNEEDLHSNADTISETPSMLLPPENPNRVYKIVFVGDSGVGKSSFIYRFCFEDFRPNFSATIGVDFQVKTIQVNRQWTALQLWDTAGQERFRSITKQYFRRADGVVVMFDLTSEASFLHVKQWMVSIEEGAEPDCMKMVIGSKCDLVEKEQSLRKIKKSTAEALARDYDASYAEVSSLSGDGVSEAMLQLAQKMSRNEDALLKYSVLNLDVSGEKDKKKKKCC